MADTPTPGLPEAEKAIREALGALMTPIGNMTDPQTRVLRSLERQNAYQQAVSPNNITALLSLLASKDAEIERLRADARRWEFVRHHWSNAQMRWNNDEANSLKSIVLTVKVAHWTSGADELEQQIDAALAAQGGGAP